MKPLELIPASPKSIGVKFLPEGILSIYGVSCDEDPRPIYEQFKTWVKEYLLNPAPKTEVFIRLKYFNTSSSKCLFELLNTLTLLDKSNKELVITWYFEKDDEDMEESIVLFEDLIKRKIERVGIDSYDAK